jgi:hypothetical protein
MTAPAQTCEWGCCVEPATTTIVGPGPGPEPLEYRPACATHAVSMLAMYRGTRDLSTELAA